MQIMRCGTNLCANIATIRYKLLCPGQNSCQNRAQDSVGTCYAVWLKPITPKLLLQTTNLAGIWSFTNDNQFTFSRMLWNGVEELQTEEVSIHTGCMNWFDSWEYMSWFFLSETSFSYSVDFMEGAINGFGFHLPPQGPSGVTCAMNLFTSWILARSCYMKTHALQYNFVNSITYLAQMYLFLPGPV